MDRRRAIDRPEVHALYRDWRKLADSYGDRVLVAEIDYADPARIAPYVRPDELHLAFNFTLLKRPWDAAAMREAIDATRAAVATPTWVLESHDVHRLATRWGGLRQARAAALLLLALPGMVFLYQGQELGLPHVELPPGHDAAGKGRDGARVPIPWDGVPERSWLPVPADWDALVLPAIDLDAFLDLRAIPAGGDWLRQPIVARPLGYGPMRAVWPRHFDGLVFTRTMTRSTPVNAR